MSSNKTWDKRFIELATLVAGWSKDHTTHVGCVIVGRGREVRSLGYNGFPRGVDDEVPSRHERPMKYMWTEHAERNAIYNATMMGVSLEGCTIYIKGFPCCDCARAIIQCGIKVFVGTTPNFDNPTYGEAYRQTIAMFQEAGVAFRTLPREDYPEAAPDPAQGHSQK